MIIDDYDEDVMKGLILSGDYHDCIIYQKNLKKKNHLLCSLQNDLAVNLAVFNINDTNFLYYQEDFKEPIITVLDNDKSLKKTFDKIVDNIINLMKTQRLFDVEENEKCQFVFESLLEDMENNEEIINEYEESEYTGKSR